MKQSLYFNIIPFHWPEKPITIYFHKDTETHSRNRIHKHLFPNDLDSIIEGITPQTDFIACSYRYENEDFQT